MLPVLNDTITFKNELRLLEKTAITNKKLGAVFPTFFGSWHPYLVLKISDGNPSWFIRYTDQEIVTIDGTPGTSSQHASVPRYPGCEPLS